MQSLQVQGDRYELQADNRLANLSEWNEDLARALAEREGLTLTRDHWDVIYVMRDFYDEFNLSPIRKLLRKALAERCGPEKATDELLARLFPGDVLVQGTRIAGLPLPMLDAELESSVYAASAPEQPGHVTHFVAEFEFDGQRYRVYPHGNLVNPEQWSEPLAEFLAGKEGITLTPEHWQVIHFLRRFYFQYGISPMVRLLMTHMREQFGAEKSSEEYLYGLFPKGPSRQGSRIAGLPEPQGCIDP